MATLTLNKVWVNRWDNGQAVSGLSARDREEAYSIVGEVRTYGGGRQRSITTQGEHGSYGFTLRRISRADVETLRAWKGIAVQVRDHAGRRFVGTYFALPVREYPDDVTVFDVAITVQVTTVDES